MIMLDRKNIIFDLGGVLLDIMPEFTIAAFNKICVNDALITEWSERGHSVFSKFECGLITSEDFCREISVAIGYLYNNITEEIIKKAWCAMLCDIPLQKIHSLRLLREQGYRIILLSNTNIIHWEVIKRIFFDIEGKPVDFYFDSIYLSFEMHLCKPNAEIFQKVLEHENLNACDCLFFDDSCENCNAASSLGISSYLIKRNDPYPEWLVNKDDCLWK